MLRRLTSVSCAFGLLLCAAVAVADTGVEQSTVSMEGIEAVVVKVYMRSAEDVAGMNVSDIRNLVELELRKLGIPVQEQATDAIDTNGVLAVSCITSKAMDLPDRTIRGFSLHSQFWQYVTLPRNPFWKNAGVTWQSKPTAGLELIGDPAMRLVVEQSLLGQTREFARAFMKVNPK